MNIALSKCRADFIANLDGGGLAHPKRLEVQYKVGKKIHRIRRLLQSKYHHKQENKIGVANTFKYSASLERCNSVARLQNSSKSFTRFLSGERLSSKQEITEKNLFRSSTTTCR